MFENYLHRPLGNIEDGNIESSAPEIVDQNMVNIGALVQSIGHGGGGGLLHHSHHLNRKQENRITEIYTKQM